MSSTSPPPSPSGRTSSGNYLRSNFSSSPARERPQPFTLQDEGKGTPDWMKKLLEQKKAEYRARWGALPDETSTASTAKPSPDEEKVPETVDDDEDGETIEEVIYEEEEEEIIEEEVIDDDEYTEEEIITTDDEYTYEEVISDQEDVFQPAHKGGKRASSVEESSRPPTKPTAPTPPAYNVRSSLERNRPEPPQRQSMVLARPAPQKVATTSTMSSRPAVAPPPKQTPKPAVAPPQQSMAESATRSAPPPARAVSPDALGRSASPNAAELRKQLAALEVQLAEARARQASRSPSPPTQRQAVVPAKPPASATQPKTTTAAAAAATKAVTSKTAQPAQTSLRNSATTKRPASPVATTQNVPPSAAKPRSVSPTARNQASSGKAAAATAEASSTAAPPLASSLQQSSKDDASPKRVQFSQSAPPAPTRVPAPQSFAVPPPPVKAEEDSMYDYVIEIETTSSYAGGSTSVYEIEYEDASTIASRQAVKPPPTIDENDVENPKKGAKGREEPNLKPRRSWQRIGGVWLGCCALFVLVLVGALVAGYFLVDDDQLDFIPFLGDHSDDGATRGTNATIAPSSTYLDTSEPLPSPTTAPASTPSTPGGGSGPSPTLSPVPPTGPGTSLPTVQTTGSPTSFYLSTLMPSVTVPISTSIPATPTIQSATPTFRPATSIPTLFSTVTPLTTSPTPAPSFSSTTAPTGGTVITESPTQAQTIPFDTEPPAGETTGTPTRRPTGAPTSSPTSSPVSSPTYTPTSSPTLQPTFSPITLPPPQIDLEWTLTSGPFTTNAEDSRFGEALSMNGNILVAGAPGFGSGLVQAYSRASVTGTWNTLNAIIPPAGEAGDFGASVSVSVGSSRVTVAVGAPTSLDDQGFEQRFGAAFYYELSGPNWTQLGSRVAPIPGVFTAGGEAGASVAAAADSRRMAVGAPGISLDANNVDNGQVFFYEFDGTTMNLLSTLNGPDPDGLFGSALAITPDGNRLLVGAPGESGLAGAAFYFEWTGSGWDTMFTLPGGNAGDNLGTSVAILDDAGDVIAIGAPNYSDGRGLIRVYSRQGGSFWSPLGRDIVGEPGQLLGATLAAGPNNRVVAGIAAGSFRAFELDPQQNDWITVGTGEPDLGSNIASIASNTNGDVALGTTGESVTVYGL